MDARMPGMDRLEVTRRILGSKPGCECRIIILTTFDLDEYVSAALTGPNVTSCTPATARPGIVVFAATGSVNSVAFSPNGKTLASGGIDGTGGCAA